MPRTTTVIGRSGFRIPALLLIAVMGLSVGWARRFPKPGVTTIKAKTWKSRWVPVSQ
jgi:uncharacterized membrane protein SpoIIM required for sporulation